MEEPDLITQGERRPEPPPAANESDPMLESQQAWLTLLFKRHRDALYRYLCRIVSPDDASELVQEAYFRLLRHRNVVRLDAMARGLLFETATNLARDLRRRQATHHAARHVSLEDADERVTEVGPVEYLATEDTLRSLESALRRMPEDMRMMFALHRFRDLNYEAIARVMGCGVRTVARKVAEAMVRLADAVEEAG